MKKIVFILLTALSISIQAQTVKVAAAGNMKYVLEEIIKQYNSTNPSVKIIANYGSSGALFQQIMNGADFDIYLAADKLYTDKLQQNGVTQGSPKTYAFGKLVLWSNSVDVEKGIDILKDASVKKIAIVKPEVGPYGARAIECMKFYQLYDEVKSKLVFAESINQAAQFTSTGNSEVCFISLTTALAPEMKGKYFLLDPASYKPAEQAVVLLKNWKNNPESAKFMNYILGEESRSILEKNGFIVPKQK